MRSGIAAAACLQGLEKNLSAYESIIQRPPKVKPVFYRLLTSLAGYMDVLPSGIRDV